jgi:hypothetical protein
MISVNCRHDTPDPVLPLASGGVAVHVGAAPPARSAAPLAARTVDTGAGATSTARQAASAIVQTRALSIR